MIKGIHALYTMKYETYLKIFFAGLFCVNVIYKSNTEISALCRQYFLWLKETQWCVLFADFFKVSDKSASFLNLFLIEG